MNSAEKAAIKVAVRNVLIMTGVKLVIMYGITKAIERSILEAKKVQDERAD